MWLGRGGLREGQLVPEADAESRRESAPIVPEGRAPGFKRELIPRVHRRAWSPIRDGTGQKGRCWGASPPSRKGESRRRKNMGLGVLTAGTGWGAEAIVVGAALGTLGSPPRRTGGGASGQVWAQVRSADWDSPQQPWRNLCSLTLFKAHVGGGAKFWTLRSSCSSWTELPTADPR